MSWGDTGKRARTGTRIDRVRGAIRSITTLVHRDRRVLGSRPAWGQFLDIEAGNRQIGIYGTTAAIQMLSSEPVGGTSPSDAIPTLPGVPTTDGAASLNPDDLALTLKCAAVIEALAANVKSCPLSPVETLVIDSMQHNVDLTLPAPTTGSGMFAGWGLATDHINVDFRQVQPTVLATAQVIIALRNADTASRVAPDEQIEVERKVAYAMRWVWDQVQTNSKTTDMEWAFTLLAAKTFAGDADVAGVPASRMVRELLKTLNKRLRGTRIADRPPAEPLFYAIHLLGNKTETHYVTFPVHSVIAWALAEGVSGRIPRQRQVFEIVDGVTDAVDTHKAPVSIATGGKGITDSLYAVKLLRAVSERVEQIDASWLRRWGWHASAVGGVFLGSAALIAGAVVAGIVSVTGSPDELRGVATVLVGLLPIPAVEVFRRGVVLIKRGP